MLPRLAWIVIASLALPSLAFAHAEEEVVAAIGARLDANRRNGMAAWATFVADDMMAPLEGPRRSKESRIVFAKAAGGRVTHYVCRDLGATDRIVRKIK